MSPRRRESGLAAGETAPKLDGHQAPSSVSSVPPVDDDAAADFSELLGLLGYGSGDPVVICHRKPGGVFASERTSTATAPEVADRYAGDCDVWFGVNPVAGKGSGRGTVQDVTRLATLWCDLDVKPGGLPTWEAAYAVVAVLADMMGCQPSAVVQTGHGLQPY